MTYQNRTGQVWNIPDAGTFLIVSSQQAISFKPHVEHQILWIDAERISLTSLGLQPMYENKLLETESIMIRIL